MLAVGGGRGTGEGHLSGAPLWTRPSGTLEPGQSLQGRAFRPLGENVLGTSARKGLPGKI